MYSWSGVPCKCHTGGQRHPFNEQHGFQKNLEGVLEAFLLFSDQHLMILLLQPTGMLIIVLKVLPLNTGHT
jgi:hypothetical protein